MSMPRGGATNTKFGGEILQLMAAFFTSGAQGLCGFDGAKRVVCSSGEVIRKRSGGVDE